MKRLLMAGGSVLVAASALAAPAIAEDASMNGWSVEGNFSLVSDYRFRGVSQTGEELAIQGGLDLSLDSGFYAGLWGSSINFANGTELDVYGGYGGELEAISYDVGVLAYHYPDTVDDQTVWELYGSLGATLGMIDTSLGVAYIPDQDDTGDESNTYVYLTGDVPLGDSPFSLSGSVGYTDGVWDFSEDGDGAWDWSLGVSASAGGVDIGLTYIGTSDLDPLLDLGDEQTVVLSVGRAF